MPTSRHGDDRNDRLAGSRNHLTRPGDIANLGSRKQQPPSLGRENMLGQMMNQPLLISAQIAHAARYHADG
ncbi:MAG: hypothetical protein VX377_05855, partial [Pseudomonadota bacterium]|nr:hypothetical protein [Pseudomonadota bacterium]